MKGNKLDQNILYELQVSKLIFFFFPPPRAQYAPFAKYKQEIFLFL